MNMNSVMGAGEVPEVDLQQVMMFLFAARWSCPTDRVHIPGGRVRYEPIGLPPFSSLSRGG
jgi:hypothetical protein